MDWQAFFVLLGVGLLYLVIVWLTYSWMIAAPRRWLLKSQISRLRAGIEISMQTGLETDKQVGALLKAELAGLNESARLSQPPRDQKDQKCKKAHKKALVRRSFHAVNLNELMAAQQTLNGLSRLRSYLVPDDDLASFAETIFLRLSEADKVSEKSLRDRFKSDSITPNARRIIVARADELCHAREDAALRADFDRERASLWLALVGLWGAIAVGSMLGHVETLLLGAIGGFLAPLIDARLSNATETTWGVRVLSPVGGALTAVGGLLMVTFLASEDIGLLGQVFQDVWNDPTTAVSLALALLFGFSGKMFSNMAITASSQIAGSRPADETKGGIGF